MINLELLFNILSFFKSYKFGAENGYRFINPLIKLFSRENYNYKTKN